ncbi:MAG: glycosyltransferase [Thermodesulfobacteriota bacterium]
MSQHQQEHWNKIPHEILKEIEVIVTDDCSPNYPAIDYVVPVRQFQMRLYRIKKNVRWDQTAAKNIGAYEAKEGWLLLTDMDHLIPAETLQYLINRSDRIQSSSQYILYA